MNFIKKLLKKVKPYSEKLGECSNKKCDRSAMWKTNYVGNLCNTCHDRYLGLD